jgi:hypothetical protein
MKKKISLKYYRNALSSEIAEIDYNDLRALHYTKDGKFTRLLGSNEDRIEAYLMRKGWIKINITTFNKLKDGFEEERTILQDGNRLGRELPKGKPIHEKV